MDCEKGGKNMPQGMVHIENLVKRYGDLTALNHLDLDIREGEIFGLLGPNGSGKTTAISCLLSLLKYDRGQVEIFGEEMKLCKQRAFRALAKRNTVCDNSA